MEDNVLCTWVLRIEAFLCALVIGGWQMSWLWFFGALFVAAVVLRLPIIGGAIGLFISMILSVGVSSFFSNDVTKWYVGIILFAVLAVVNSVASEEGHIFFGFSIVIFEAFFIAGTMNFSTGKIVLPICIFVLLTAISFAPLLRLLEYVILSVGTVIYIYAYVKEELIFPHTLALPLIILVLLGYFFFMAYFAIDYDSGIKNKKIQSRLQKIAKLYPNLENSGTEYEHILNRCKDDHERLSFFRDWINYKLALWAEHKRNGKNASSGKVPFTFESWYRVNNRWKDTTYFHAYYEKQVREERYIEEEKDRIRKLWVCEYCGRLNSKNNMECSACGALQKVIIPQENSF